MAQSIGVTITNTQNTSYYAWNSGGSGGQSTDPFAGSTFTGQSYQDANSLQAMAQATGIGGVNDGQAANPFANSRFTGQSFQVADTITVNQYGDNPGHIPESVTSRIVLKFI